MGGYNSKSFSFFNTDEASAPPVQSPNIPSPLWSSFALHHLACPTSTPFRIDCYYRESTEAYILLDVQTSLDQRYTAVQAKVASAQMVTEGCNL